MANDVIESVEDGIEIIEIIEEGPQGPQGLSIPTEIVEEFPETPVIGTLYIKVAP